MKFTSLTTFAAVLSITSGLSSSSVVPEAPIKPYLDNKFIQKRDFIGETQDEKAKYALDWNINAMKKLVHEEYVNLTKFAEEKIELRGDIDYTSTWIEKNKFVKDYKEEIAYMKHLLKSLEVAEDIRNRFTGCNYWGSDLAMQMAMLSIRALNLKTFNESSLDATYQSRKGALEFLMESLEERASKDTKMSSRMRNLFEERTKDTRKSLELLKEATDAVKKGFMEKNEICEEF